MKYLVIHNNPNTATLDVVAGYNTREEVEELMKALRADGLADYVAELEIYERVAS